MRKPEETCPLILQMPAAGQFWERVRQRQFMAWAFMNPAIMGVVGWGIRIPHAILYDTEKLLTSLYNSQSTSTQSDKAQRWDDAKRFFAQRMLPFDCGESTPWYFTQL